MISFYDVSGAPHESSFLAWSRPDSRRSAVDAARSAGSTLQESSAAKREPEVVTLLGVVGVDAELAEATDPVDDRMAVDAEAIGRVPDAPAVEQRLERGDELEPPVGRALRERA